MENGNKKSLISSIIFCVVLFLQSGCTSEIEIENIGNGKSEVHDVRPPFTIRATVSSFTGLEVTDKLSIGNPSTRTGEDGYTTVFKPGDAIGVFALRDFETPNIATIDNVYNLKLVYSETDGVGTWLPESGDTHVLYSYDEASITWLIILIAPVSPSSRMTWHISMPISPLNCHLPPTSLPPQAIQEAT